ncbi:MAG TPA: S41 family peptidase [Anaerolineae bacterium]|nr:S41 family peptidase [Anaerolineae bacterium]
MSNWHKWGLVALVIVLVGSTTFAAGFGVGCYVWPAYRHLPPAVAEDQPEEFAVFWEAWQLIEDRFYREEPLDQKAMTYGAVRGMVASLGDRHTVFLTPEEGDMFDEDLKGEFGGIGVTVVSTDEGYLRATRLIPGAPAEKAGVRPGDLILEVDGNSLRGLAMPASIGLLRGTIGTEVRLLLRRPDDELVELALTRALIEIPVVEARMLDDGIAYLALWECSGRATRDLRASLKQLLAEEPRALLLDLRGNPGGYLDTAVQIASEFITDGVVLLERDRHGSETKHKAQSGGIATDLPLAVLVDGATASAAEIIAGAIRDNDRGLLIGEQTFGKGSVQISERLSDRSSLRVTIMRWYTPSGQGINGEGLTPDIVIELSEEDLLAERDVQLEEAVTYLLGQLSP